MLVRFARRISLMASQVESSSCTATTAMPIGRKSGDAAAQTPTTSPGTLQAANRISSVRRRNCIVANRLSYKPLRPTRYLLARSLDISSKNDSQDYGQSRPGDRFRVVSPAHLHKRDATKQQGNRGQAEEQVQEHTERHPPILTPARFVPPERQLLSASARWTLTRGRVPQFRKGVLWFRRVLGSR
jgi:hypothetical protein